MAGFFQVERSLLDRMGSGGNLTVADFKVMMIAMRDTKLPGDSVTLGIDYLAGGTGLDRSTVIRSRRRLVQLGYLVPGGFGQRGLAQFAVATGGVAATPQTMLTGGVAATPGGADATPSTDARGGAGATPRGGVDATPFTLHETGNLLDHTTEEQPPSSTSVDGQEKTDPPDELPTPDPEPSPQVLALAPSTGKKKGGTDVPPPAGAKRKVADKAKPSITPHPVFLEWNQERTAAGLDPSVAGPQNNAFAAKLQEAVPDPVFRRNVLKVYFARKDDTWLAKEGFVFYQLVNHRLDQCIAAARKAGSDAARSAPSGSTGEAKRRMQYLKDDGHTPRCGW